MTKTFYSRCVGWPSEKMLAKTYLDDMAEDITREEFLTLVDTEEMASWENTLGYGDHLQMADDYHVSYHLDRATGIPYFCHSGIEHVFADPEEIDALQERLANISYSCPALIVNPIAMADTPAEDGLMYDNRLEEVLEEASTSHDGIVILSDSSLDALPAHLRANLDEVIFTAHDAKQIGLRLFTGAEEAPQGFFAKVDPSLTGEQELMSYVEGLYGVMPTNFEMYAPQVDDPHMVLV